MALSASSHQNFGTFGTMPTQGTPGCGYIPPPPYPVPDYGGQPVQRSWNIPCISESEAQAAFLEYASSHCCYSSTPAREMVFEELQAFNTYRYRLETFTESRSLEWRTKPFTGKIEVPVLTAELPWNVPVAVPEMFENNTKEIIMPHTSSIKECSVCMASGKRPCKQCGGRTKEQCHWCKGTGVFISDTCSHCSGTGSSATPCIACSGMGTVNCSDCNGQGRLLTYNALVVQWKNNIFEYVAHQRNDFPDKLFHAVTGQKLLVDEHDMVYPVINFPDSSINNASMNAVERHRTQFTSTSRILRQRQTIEHIPLTRVEYRWREAAFSFYVYGNERKVYTENYPQKCCCTII
ncbi:protein SSUH2 homolog [Heteronotia binoei]|uniref:protein SSUH2 homolog n=1 Tax=Heteronotia binoei TaxID=13085 RepID=UPI0029309FC0|nr:protein SSUH2 homolog [Heteronotia binoei]